MRLALRNSLDASGGRFTPTQVGGLKLWLRPDAANVVLSAGKVTTLADMSGNGLHATEVTDANRFTYVASSLNGKPGLSMVGSQRLTTASIDLTTFTAFAVFTHTATGRIWTHGAAGYLDGSNTATMYTARGAGSAKALTAAWSQTSAPIIARHSFDGTHVSHTLHLNGASQVLSTYAGIGGDPGAAVGSGTIAIGGPGGTGGTGTFYEFIIFTPAISAANATRIERYLASRYAVTIV